MFLWLWSCLVKIFLNEILARFQPDLLPELYVEYCVILTEYAGGQLQKLASS